MDPVDVVVIAAGIALVWWAPAARNRRSGVVLGALATTFVLASIAMTEPLRGAVKIGVILTYVVIVLRFPVVLGRRPAQDLRADAAIRTAMSSLDVALMAWRREPTSSEARKQVAAVCEDALARLDQLPRDDRRWSTTVELVRRYVSTVRDAAIERDLAPPTPLPSSVSGPAAHALVEQIEEEWRAALHG